MKFVMLFLVLIMIARWGFPQSGPVYNFNFYNNAPSSNKVIGDDKNSSQSTNPQPGSEATPSNNQVVSSTGNSNLESKELKWGLLFSGIRSEFKNPGGDAPDNLYLEQLNQTSIGLMIPLSRTYFFIVPSVVLTDLKTIRRASWFDGNYYQKYSRDEAERIRMQGFGVSVGREFWYGHTITLKTSVGYSSSQITRGDYDYRLKTLEAKLAPTINSNNLMLAGVVSYRRIDYYDTIGKVSNAGIAYGAELGVRF